MTRAHASELADLAFHWDEAYVIDFDGTAFTAARMGEPAKMLTADTPWSLRLKIREDYGIWGRQVASLMSPEQEGQEDA